MGTGDGETDELSGGTHRGASLYNRLGRLGEAEAQYQAALALAAALHYFLYSRLSPWVPNFPITSRTQ